MATPSFTRTEQPGGCTLFTWQLTTADNTGEAIQIPGAADKTVQFSGTWDGATAVLEGSNISGGAGAYVTLTSAASGSALAGTSDTAGAMACIVENPLYLRPRLSVVGTAATVNVNLLVRTT
jgi:hypothetical protein